MAVHVSSRAAVAVLAGLAALCTVFHSPLLGFLLPWLTGQCGPELGPASRWNDWWGIGWMRFHTQLVKEVVKADKGQVGAPSMLAAL